MVSEDSDSGSAIASDFIKFLCGGFDEFGTDLFAEIIIGSAKIDGFSDGDAIVSDGGGTIGFFDNNILAFRTIGDFDSIVKLFSAT